MCGEKVRKCELERKRESRGNEREKKKYKVIK